MGRYIKQDQTRSELQQRLAAELRAKAAARNNQEGDTPDGIDDSAYVEGTKRTTPLAGLWLFVAVLAALAFAGFVYLASIRYT